MPKSRQMGKSQTRRSTSWKTDTYNHLWVDTPPLTWTFSKEDEDDKIILQIHDVQHMEYEEMVKHLTPPIKSRKFLQQISDMLQEGQFKRIKENFKEVFQGIGKHRYSQVPLLIDENIKPIVQLQRKILFAKREKLDSILDELEESGGGGSIPNFRSQCWWWCGFFNFKCFFQFGIDTKI